MKIKLMCPECAPERDGSGTWFVEKIREDDLYTGKCPMGHDLLLATQTLPHEMLFEIALNAVVDGYHREAVSSFMASMERFFEFAIRVICNKNAVPHARFNENWNVICKQSERQVGAYIFLYLSEFKTGPRLLSSKMVKLRNDVVHNGKMPNRNDALAFGDDVYKVIQDAARQLRLALLDQVNNVLGEHVTRIAQGMGTTYPRTFQVTSTALNIIDDVASGYKPFGTILREFGITN